MGLSQVFAFFLLVASAAFVLPTPVALPRSKLPRGLPFVIVDQQTEFFDKYAFVRPLEMLGEGGFSKVIMGTIRRSQGNHKQEKIAIKCLDMTEVNKDPHGLKDLQNETSILAKCDHANIIKLYDFIEDSANRMYWMVLEVVDGGELFTRIIRKEKYTEAEGRDAILELLDVLGYLHDMSIVHRDLKPENLLLKSNESDSELKLADFGFAALCHGENRRTQCGTPGYVAPEIILDKQYGVQADMWSCGVILFILLGGYPPFYGQQQEQMFRDIVAANYTFAPEYWDPVSADAKDLIRKMLTVDPAKRITARQAMRHPWFLQATTALMSINLDKSLAQFRSWNAKRKLQGAGRAVMTVNRLKKAGMLHSASASTSSGGEADKDQEPTNLV